MQASAAHKKPNYKEKAKYGTLQQTGKIAVGNSWIEVIVRFLHSNPELDVYRIAFDDRGAFRFPIGVKAVMGGGVSCSSVARFSRVPTMVHLLPNEGHALATPCTKSLVAFPSAFGASYAPKRRAPPARDRTPINAPDVHSRLSIAYLAMWAIRR